MNKTNLMAVKNVVKEFSKLLALRSKLFAPSSKLLALSSSLLALPSTLFPLRYLMELVIGPNALSETVCTVPAASLPVICPPCGTTRLNAPSAFS